MFQWFRKWRAARRAAVEKRWSSGWTVAVGGGVITAHDGRGGAASVAIERIAAIIIETTSDGPFFSDVWWWLLDDGAKPICVFPNDAGGAPDAVASLTGLAGFDHRAMIAAMGCTDDRTFPVWRKDGHEAA